MGPVSGARMPAAATAQTMPRSPGHGHRTPTADLVRDEASAQRRNPAAAARPVPMRPMTRPRMRPGYIVPQRRS